MSLGDTGTPFPWQTTRSDLATLDDTLIVRPGRSGDVEAIARLIVAENGRAADRDEIAQDLAASPSVVVERDGRLIGFIYSRRFAPDILELRNSLIASSARRAGVGTRMVVAMEDATRQAGYRATIGVNCRLHPGATDAGAAAARAFWLAMGWSIVFATDGSAVVAKHLAT